MKPPPSIKHWPLSNYKDSPRSHEGLIFMDLLLDLLLSGMGEGEAVEDALLEKNRSPKSPGLTRDQFQSAARDNIYAGTNKYSVGCAVWFRKATPLKARWLSTFMHRQSNRHCHRALANGSCEGEPEDLSYRSFIKGLVSIKSQLVGSIRR